MALTNLQRLLQQDAAPAAPARRATAPPANLARLLAAEQKPEQDTTTPAIGRIAQAISNPVSLAASIVNNPEDIRAAGAGFAEALVPGLVPTVGGMFEGARRAITGSPGDLRSNVDAATEDIRQALTTAQEGSPVAGLVGQVGGALASPANKLKLVAEGAMGLGRTVPRIINAGASGGAYGGLYAADKGEDIGSGAALGGALGGGIAAAGAVAGKVLRSPPARAGGRAVLRLTTGRTPKGLEGATSGDLVRGFGGVRGAEDAARRMEADLAAGRPAMVGDYSTGAARLARLARNRSPEAADILNDAVNVRQAGQIDRFESTVRRTLPANANQTREGLDRAADIVNPQAYERAMRHPNAQNLWNRELAQLTIAPPVRRAIAEATNSAANEAALTGIRPFRNPFRAAPDGTLSMVPGVTPNLRFWDAVKKNLDKGYASATPGDQRYIAKLGEQLRNLLDTAVPDYAAARSQAAAFFGAKDAIEAGAKFATSRVSNEQARALMAKLPQVERDLFAEGYATAQIALARERGANTQVADMFKSPAARERLEIAVGPRRAREIETEVLWERTAARLRQSVQGGSSTGMEAWLGTGMAAGAMGGAGLYMGGGNPLNPNAWLTALATAALIRAGKSRGAVNDEALLRRLAEMLTSNDPATIRRAIEVMSRTPALRRVMQVMENNVSKAVVAGTQDSQGARQARDGQWYVPDGSRPGRYLRVRQQ